jgi:tetratricopeptide (TPR) repeat protein
VVHLEQAVQLDERSDIARANLARAYQLAGRDDDAAREAQVARLAVHHVPPVLAAAEVYEAIGRDDDAIDTYAQVLSMDASLADSTFWEGSPWRREHFDEILAGSSLTLNPCTRLVPGADAAPGARRLLR